MELYTLNEPGRFPAGIILSYEKALLEGRQYHMVAESDGRIVASGGIHYWIRKDIATLCYGLIHPKWHGKGIGTALVLARLALLKADLYDYCVFIFAVEKSIGFYRRFGFGNFKPWQDSQGIRHPSGLLHMRPSEIRACRSLLKDHNIIWPSDEDRVPLILRKKLEP